MIYEKVALFGDKEIAKKIVDTYHPQEAKKLGRLARGFNNEIWESHREDVIFSIVYTRIVYDQELRLTSLGHRMDGRSFVEASPWDKIYGIGMKETDPVADDPANCKDLNLLGKAWDKATDSLAQKCGGYELMTKERATWGM